MSDSSDEDAKPKVKLGEALYDIIDTRFSNISLLEKQQMEDWRKIQEELKQMMEKEKSSLEENLKNAKNESTKMID